MMKHKIVEIFSRLCKPPALRLLFNILRDVIFLFPRAPSVCGSAQTGRGGVLGENLLVTTSYQYALTSDSDSSVSSSNCSSTRSGGDFALTRMEISRGSQQHKYAAMTPGNMDLTCVYVCVTDFTRNPVDPRGSIACRARVVQMSENG
ncbi:BMP-binding endothelial regulator protein [Temnothorax longispinosus]|uniref:BMP-binding endothelial regulator protein n=1 Tax=Temnothorax longispinosus TaxID=300112 RepID=A0A4S2K1T3_9HYME|nr:BMP-binding endothelial regulator protein [Temnothorax longispinosus]